MFVNETMRSELFPVIRARPAREWRPFFIQFHSQHPAPLASLNSNLTENLPQTEMTPFTYGFWRRVSGACHPGSLTDFVTHYIKKIGSRSFNFSDTPRMDSRLHMGVPLPAQISEPCPEYLKRVMDVKNVLRGLIALALVVNQDFVSQKARGIRDLYTLRIGKGKSIRPVKINRPWRVKQRFRDGGVAAKRFRLHGG